jgi:acyl carrier protein
MAAAAGERGQRRWREQGIEMIDPVTGLQALARLLRASAVQALVLPVRWRTWRRDQAGGTPPLLSTILGQRTAETAAPSLTRAAVLDAPPGEREGLVATYLANQIGGILRISAAQIGGEQPLIELGIDSLMAVELKNRIELDLGVVVPVATILDGASVSTLGSEILAQVEDRCGVTGRQVQDTTGGAGAVARPDDPERARALLATVDQLSDAEVAQLLHELLPQEAGPT